jgi:hypothetical protein
VTCDWHRPAAARTGKSTPAQTIGVRRRGSVGLVPLPRVYRSQRANPPPIAESAVFAQCGVRAMGTAMLRSVRNNIMLHAASPGPSTVQVTTREVQRGLSAFSRDSAASREPRGERAGKGVRSEAVPEHAEHDRPGDDARPGARA